MQPNRPDFHSADILRASVGDEDPRTFRSGAAAVAGAFGALREDLLLPPGAGDLPPGDLARARPTILQGTVM